MIATWLNSYAQVFALTAFVLAKFFLDGICIKYCFKISHKEAFWFAALVGLIGLLVLELSIYVIRAADIASIAWSLAIYCLFVYQFAGTIVLNFLSRKLDYRLYAIQVFTVCLGIGLVFGNELMMSMTRERIICLESGNVRIRTGKPIGVGVFTSREIRVGFMEVPQHPMSPALKKELSAYCAQIADELFAYWQKIQMHRKNPVQFSLRFHIVPRSIVRVTKLDHVLEEYREYRSQLGYFLTDEVNKREPVLRDSNGKQIEFYHFDFDATFVADPDQIPRKGSYIVDFGGKIPQLPEGAVVEIK